MLLRWAGFAGHELGGDNTLDIYVPSTNSWQTVQPATPAGAPGPRSVHGFAPLLITGDSESLVAVMWMGERDPSSSGHEGAGAFWDDVWGLVQSHEVRGTVRAHAPLLQFWIARDSTLSRIFVVQNIYSGLLRS